MAESACSIIYRSSCEGTILKCFCFVAEAPYFYKEPLSQLRAAEGGRVKFRCKVKGEPRPFLVWYRNNELITPHADDRWVAAWGCGGKGNPRWVSISWQDRKCFIFSFFFFFDGLSLKCTNAGICSLGESKCEFRCLLQMFLFVASSFVFNSFSSICTFYSI